MEIRMLSGNGSTIKSLGSGMMEPIKLRRRDPKECNNTNTRKVKKLATHVAQLDKPMSTQGRGLAEIYQTGIFYRLFFNTFRPSN